MAKYLDDIVDYVQGLATHHPSLAHAETVGQRTFEVMAYEQAFGDFKTAGAPQTYFLRLILPTMSWEGHGNNAQKRYQIGLLCGKYFSRREDSKTAMVDAWAAAEKVLDDIVARMVYDSREGTGPFNHTLDNIDSAKITGDYLEAQGDGSYCAVLYTLEFGTFRCVDADGAEFLAVGWTDL